MTTNKITSGDYTISVGPYDSGSTQWTGTMTINGNLNVTGNISTIDDLNVANAFIVVAANNTGVVTSMGMVAQKSPTTFAGLRYNSLTSQWEISNSTYGNGQPVGNTYQPIATQQSASNAAGSNTQIQYNSSGVFGANANLTYDYANSKLTLQGYQVLGYTATPANVANSVAIYSNNVGSGGTGVYFTSSQANGELVCKTKAIVFSLIF